MPRGLIEIYVLVMMGVVAALDAGLGSDEGKGSIADEAGRKPQDVSN